MFEKKSKYLEFVQNIIARMAECSFKCKEFYLLLLTGLITVFATIDSHPFWVLFISCGITIIFWILDTFYLWQEKGFRKLYNQKSVLNAESDFEDFQIKPNTDGLHYFKVLFSKTEWILYLPIFISLIIFASLLCGKVLVL